MGLKVTIELSGSDYSPEDDRTGQADMSVDHRMTFDIPVDPMRGPTLSQLISKANSIAAFIRQTFLDQNK